MSEYKSFERCVVCRTKILWDEYRQNNDKDNLEITLAINMLTALLARFDGLQEEYGLEPPYAKLQEKMPICEFWKCKDGTKIAIDKNQIPFERRIHYLRNGMAHIHMDNENKNGKIDRICIRSKNIHQESYEFVFQAKEFCDFLDALLNVLLEVLNTHEFCDGCKYEDKQ